MKLKKALEMASLLLIIICVYLTLNSYVQTSVVVSEDQYGNPDWKMAMKQIEELQKIVKNMDDYSKIVKRQNGRIAQLESRVRFLEAIVRLEENGPVDLQTYEKGNEFNGTNAISKGSLKIRLNGAMHHTTELLVDNNIINSIYLNPNNAIDGGVTGTVVVHVNQGDDVFVRTGLRYNNGDIKSDSDGRSSFAGWILI